MRQRRLALHTARGQALPIVIIAMALFAVLIVAVMSGVTSQQSATAREQSSQSALGLADAAVSDALSVLSNAPNPLDPQRSRPAPRPKAAARARTAGSRRTMDAHRVGTLPSPVAGAGVLRRTSTLEVSVSNANSPWQYLFADSSKGCLQIKNNAQITTPLYSRGNLCLGNNARVTGSPVAVDGTVKIKNNAAIGSPCEPVASATLGGCVGGGGPAHPCTQADHVYATTLVQATSNLVKPALDLASWYANAAPGPSHPWTSGSVPGGFDNDATLNNSARPSARRWAADDDCQYSENGALTGRLAWNAASHALTVQGTILFDGSLSSAAARATWAGDDLLDGADHLLEQHPSVRHACVRRDLGPGHQPARLVAGGAAKRSRHPVQENNSVFQGALYAVNDFSASNRWVLFEEVIWPVE